MIPVYNAAKYLPALLENIVAQNADDMEVILLNDGSKDDSLQVCKKFEGQYPDLVRVISRENMGAVCTRRELFEASRGEWIWIIDSDDNIAEDAVSTLRALIRETKADMFLFDHFTVDSTGKTKNTADRL